MIVDFETIASIAPQEKIEVNLRSKLQRSVNGLTRTIGSWVRISDPKAENVLSYVDELARRTLNILILEEHPREDKFKNWVLTQRNKETFQRAYIGINNLFETYLKEAENAAMHKPEERQRKILICRNLNKTVSTLKRISTLAEYVTRKGLDSFTVEHSPRAGSFVDEHDFDILTHLWTIIDSANEEYERENFENLQRLQGLN